MTEETRELVRTDRAKDIAAKIKLAVPGGAGLSDNEALSLATFAITSGLNPFTGECWYIPKKGPMAGIKGLRRKSSEQSLYSISIRAMDEGEVTEHEIQGKDVGRICQLYRHDILQEAVEINRAAGEVVIPLQPIIGVGIWRGGDQVARGKSAAWMASKRAEADALKKGFNIPLPYSEEANGFDTVIEEEPWEVLPPSEDKTAGEHKDDLFGEEAEPAEKKKRAPRTAGGKRIQWQAFLKEHDLSEKEALSALGSASVNDWMKANPGKTETDAWTEILAVSGKGK